MSNIVICSKCGDPIDIEARSIDLPFTCLACEAAINKFTVEVGTPEKPEEVGEPCDCATCNPESEDLTEEFSSVENTTLLIADLEAQLAQEQLLSNSLKLEIENLQSKNDSQREIITRGSEKNLQLLIEKERQAETIRDFQEETIPRLKRELSFTRVILLVTDMFGRSFRDQAKALKAELDAAKVDVEVEKNVALLNKTCMEIANNTANGYAQRLFSSEEEIAKLTEDVKTLTNRRDFWKREAVQLGEELAQEQRPWYRKVIDYVKTIGDDRIKVRRG